MRSHESLRERLLAYMKRQPASWIASGELQRLVGKYTTYSPQNVGRRLRELCEDGKIERQLREGHAWYRPKEVPLEKEKTTAFIPGVGFL